MTKYSPQHLKFFINQGIFTKISCVFSIVQPNMGYYADAQIINRFYSPTQVQPKSNPAPTQVQPETSIFCVFSREIMEYNMLNVGFTAVNRRFRNLFRLFVT